MTKFMERDTAELLKRMIKGGSMKFESSTIRWGDIFSLDLLPGWTWSDENEGVVAIYRPDGVGAMQISFARRESARKPSKDVARQLARDFAAQRSWDIADAEIRDATIAGGSASEFEFVEHGDRPTNWHVWHVVDAHRAAFITYISEPKDAGLEAKATRQIVESFRWL